jgi:hypothetical protein
MTAKRIYVGLAMLAAVPVLYAAAARNVHADWPTAAEVAKANARVKFQTDDTAKGKFRGHDVTFIPCDIGDIPDATREKGVIIGKLETTWPSADKLPAGTYHVYLYRDSGTWKGFFCEKDKAMAKSTEVKADLDNQNKPSFEVDNTTIRFWKVRVAY